MSANDSILQAQGLYSSFPRKGGSALRATHYCAGCGHGVLHKLIGEALADFNIQDRTVVISPVGCSVFAYYYFDCSNIQAAHGRAQALGAAIRRTTQDAIVISYQGDGDLCSIGFNETFHAANRGDCMAVFFVNNAVYGMTGGQMAPTTLIGQRTTTSPTGRTAINDGYPVHACEVLNSLYAPVYIERCSLADSKRIRQARQAVRKALQIQVEGKGYAFVEFLSPCPTNLKMDPVDAAQYMIEHMEQEFPLGKLRDRSDEVVAPPRIERIYDADAIRQAFLGPAAATPSLEADSGSAAGTARIKVAGFGGQGVLSLGLMLAYAGQRAGRKTTWFPSYGPEQRGGTANCSVVLSDAPIGSPVVSETDILIALNRPSLERFAADVADQGVIFYDDTVGEVELPAHIDKAIAVPAFRIAAEKGVAKAANTAMLGAIAASGVSRLPMETFDAVLTEVFGQKAKLLKVNRAVFEAAAQWAAEHASQSPVRA